MKKLKSVVLLVTIIMIANLLIPTMTSLAALSGNYTISFSENYEVNNVTVTTNIPSGNQTVNENTNIHLNNFDSATMRAFILADDGFETDLVVDERGDTNIGTADANSAPTNSTLMFKVATKPGAVTNSGLNITFLSQSGKVWYKFNEEQEREVSSNLTDALIAGEKLTIKGENRTIGRLAIKFDNGEWQNLDKDAFKSDRGITLDNITARIIMLEVEYVNDNQEQNNFEDINVKATFKDTEGEVAINNEHTPEGPSYDGKLEKAGYTDSNKKNKIVISTSADFPVASKVKINGVTYDFKEEGYEVPGASDYIIEVEGDPSIITPKTIIWTNPDYVPKDEEDAAWTADFSIGHGYARAIEVYDKDNNLVKPDEYINTTPQPDGSKSDEYGLNNGFGWVKIMPGYKVVFEFVPEYGYQLTGIKINDEVLEPQDTINRFEFTMLNGGNIHFSAEFTKTEDIVKADSKKVSSGKVSLGENELSGGSAQLTVNDVTLSSDKITGFQNAANGYTISDYLDIDLYQVFFKGKDDSDDVWSNKIDELDKEVTITIKLEEGINGNNIVIVHNIHDGDEYEIIPTTYDEATNTITFKTKSFSNYAIATSTGTNTVSPKTGDNIAVYIIVLVFAGIGLIATIGNIKKS